MHWLSIGMALLQRSGETSSSTVPSNRCLGTLCDTLPAILCSLPRLCVWPGVPANSLPEPRSRAGQNPARTMFQGRVAQDHGSIFLTHCTLPRRRSGRIVLCYNMLLKPNADHFGEDWAGLLSRFLTNADWLWPIRLWSCGRYHHTNVTSVLKKQQKRA